MKKKNILHIVYAKEWGGGETAASSMIKEQIRYGHNITVILDKKNSYFSNKFYFVPSVEIVDFSNFFKAVFFLHKIFIERQIDVVHTHTGKVVLVVILAKFNTNTKLVAFRHNVLKNKNDLLHKWIYKNVDVFICVSKTVYDIQVNSVQENIRRKFYLVYNGIDEQLYKNTVNRDNGEMLVCGYAGRIDESKGIYHLIETMKLLKEHNVILKIAGDNNNKYGNKLRQFVINNNLEDKVEWLGFQESMVDFYSSIDVLIAPSLIPEAFGLVLCEAMYCNCAVISSDSGAQHEIVDNGINGILLNGVNSSEIFKSISLYYNDMDLLHKHQVAAKNKVESIFTIECWMHKMNVIYNTVLT